MAKTTTMMESGFLSPDIDRWAEKNRNAHFDYYLICEEFNKFCHKIAFEISPHNRHWQELLVSALFLRSLTSYQGFIRLALYGLISESKMVLRCLMEATFTLCALASHDELIFQYVQQDSLFRTKLINKLESASELVKKAVVADELQQLKEELLQETANLEIGKLTVQDLADKAGLRDWYDTAYTLLSQSVHSSARDIERHLQIDSSETVTGLNYGPSDKNVEILLFTAADCMRANLRSIDDVFALSIEQRTKDLRDRLQELGKNVKK